MTNLDLFKQWLKDRGVENPNDFAPIDDMGDVTSHLHCWGFVCPKNVAHHYIMPEQTKICKERCPYYQFWSKEV